MDGRAKADGRAKGDGPSENLSFLDRSVSVLFTVHFQSFGPLTVIP